MANIDTVTSPLTPRRMPVQDRSRRKVEAILAAAGRVLVKRGPDAYTVEAVAAEAGVPVGTLYQFFPNKHAIVNVLAFRWLARLDGLLDDLASAAQAAGPWLEHIDRMVDKSARLWADDPVARVVWVVMQATPEMQAAAEVYDRAFADRLVVVLGSLFPQRTRAQLRAMAGATIETHRAVLDLSVRNRRQDMRIVAELKTMLRGYFEASLEMDKTTT